MRCAITSAPPSEFVTDVMSTVVVNVMTPTLVGMILFVNHILSDIFYCSILIFWLMQRALQGTFAVQCNLLGGHTEVRTNFGLEP